MKKRVIAYFDGSNFYHACKRSFGMIRVDFRRLSENMLKADEEKLIRINYFAVPAKQQGDREKYRRHVSFLNGVRKTPLAEVHFGKLVRQSLGPIHFNCTSCGHQEAMILNCPRCRSGINVRRCSKLNEKGVDVKMTLAMVLDAISDSYDIMLLFSNDADFAPAVRHIISRLGKRVVYCSFPRMPTGELLQACSENRIILPETVERSSRGGKRP